MNTDALRKKWGSSPTLMGEEPKIYHHEDHEDRDITSIKQVPLHVSYLQEHEEARFFCAWDEKTWYHGDT
ncbi:MAG: hypothetical protein MR630_08160 [Selenomonas sp.]|uniref:hypothetical protein n=1 Tax=Selenomonas sp. TaxID=2053611 RepID=UPI0025E190D7|nr:hypothetical protein [Selenomonas sp.]MCI6232567.1 hypothetical protein [Selenomonas sp.]